MHFSQLKLIFLTISILDLVSTSLIASVNGLNYEGESYANSSKTDNFVVKKKFKRSTKFKTAYGQELIFDIDKTSHSLYGTKTPIFLAQFKGKKVTYQRYDINQKKNIYANHITRKRSATFNDTVNTSHKRMKLRRKRQILYTNAKQKQITVYPEVLVIVDYETFQQHGNVIAVFNYVANLYNGIDLKFRQMTYPQVRLNIAGIVIALDEKALPFAPTGMHVSTKALDEMQKYFTTGFPQFYQKINYDVIHVMLYRASIYEMRSKDDMGGYAYTGGTCQTKAGIALAITRTSGGFENSQTVAHELAHSFGAPHDGQKNECDSITGIMAPAPSGSVASFSACSIIAMRNFFESEASLCVTNPPNVGTPFEKKLPGKTLTRDQQCKMTLGAGYVQDPATSSQVDCTTLTCMHVNDRRPYPTATPPAEGSTCYKDHICLAGHCVEDQDEMDNTINPW